MEYLKYLMLLILLIWPSRLNSPGYQVSAVDIPSEWISYLQTMTAQFDEEPCSAVCIPYKGIVSNVFNVDGDVVTCNFIPNNILWDPLVQSHTLCLQMSKCLDDSCEHVMERKERQH